jgi:hypothetical protein
VDHPSHPREEKEQFFPSPGNKRNKEGKHKKVNYKSKPTHIY